MKKENDVTSLLHRSAPRSGARRFACNALMLIGVNLFMRTVGMSFNVYLSNRAGGEVMGLYSLLFGVYGLALTLGCAGVNLGTTRLVAEAMGAYCPVGQNPDREATVEGGACRTAIRRVLSRCMVYSLICSSGAAILLFIGAPVIGTVWLGDGRTVLSLRTLAITLPPLAVSSCLGGYFTAVRRVARVSAVNIGVQFLRIGFCSYLLTLWLPDGVEMTCLALVLGGALSEVAGVFLTILAYLADKRRHSVTYHKGDSPEIPDEEGLTRRLLGITVPVTLSACLRSGLLTLQHALIPRGLKRSGASWSEALASYGVVHSMVLPVVLFPSAFISSFSGLLVPEVAESCARGDGERVARISYKIVTPALIFSIGVAGIMSCYAYELGEVIYHSREAGMYIRCLAPLIPIMYVDSSVDAVLKGMGEQVYSMNVNIADALSSVIMVWILLPRMGLWGYIVTIYVTETLNTTLSLARMLPISGMRIRLWKQVFGPLACVVGATCLCRLASEWGHLPIGGTGDTVLHITVCAAVYLLLLMLTGVVGREEWTRLKDALR